MCILNPNHTGCDGGPGKMGDPLLHGAWRPESRNPNWDWDPPSGYPPSKSYALAFRKPRKTTPFYPSPQGEIAAVGGPSRNATLIMHGSTFSRNWAKFRLRKVCAISHTKSVLAVPRYRPILGWWPILLNILLRRPSLLNVTSGVFFHLRG